MRPSPAQKANPGRESRVRRNRGPNQAVLAKRKTPVRPIQKKPVASLEKPQGSQPARVKERAGTGIRLKNRAGLPPKDRRLRRESVSNPDTEHR